MEASVLRKQLSARLCSLVDTPVSINLPPSPPPFDVVEVGAGSLRRPPPLDYWEAGLRDLPAIGPDVKVLMLLGDWVDGTDARFVGRCERKGKSREKRDVGIMVFHCYAQQIRHAVLRGAVGGTRYSRSYPPLASRRETHNLRTEAGHRLGLLILPSSRPRGLEDRLLIALQLYLSKNKCKQKALASCKRLLQTSACPR